MLGALLSQDSRARIHIIQSALLAHHEVHSFTTSFSLLQHSPVNTAVEFYSHASVFGIIL